MYNQRQTKLSNVDVANAQPKINLNIHISKSPLDKNKLGPEAEKKLSAVPPDLIKELRKHEHAMFSWLNANPQNSYQLISDPIKALQAAVPDLSPELIKKISEVRQSQRPHDVKLPDVTLNKVTVDVKK